MADEIKEFSRDEVSGAIFHGTPAQSAPAQMAPVQQSDAAFTPAAGPVAPPKLAMPSKGKASVGLPDATQLVETVSKANKALKEDAAPPEAPSAVGGLVDQITSNWKPIAATAVATYAVTKAAPIISRGIGAAYDKVKNSRAASPSEATRIDPVFATEQEMAQAANAPKPNTPAPIQQTNLTPQEVQARADVLKAAPTVPPTVAELDADFAAKAPIATPISAAPVDAPAPTPSAAPNSAVTSTVVDELKTMIQEVPDQPVEAPKAAPVEPPKELLTGTGKPAFAGQGPEAVLNKSGQPKFKPEYPGIEAVPRGYAFVPNAQYIDTLRQNIGLPEYLKAYSTRDFPTSNDLAIQESKDINKMLGRATRAEAAAAGLPPAEITPGITKKTSAGTKPVRVAGTVGALMAISDLAKAETPGQRGMAGAGLLEAILPPGFTMSGAGEGSSNIPSAVSAMLLGSPYAQSPEAKKLRQEQEYIRKIGAGRGIAPPSAYMK